MLITGFAAENTLARRLIDGEKQVPILGEEHTVKARISVMQELSAHADRNNLLDFVGRIGPSLRRIFLVHGDSDALQGLFDSLTDNALHDVAVPLPGDTFDL